jgi:transposase InsO family protein
VIEGCETCSINDRKPDGGSEFVETGKKLEKAGVDVYYNEKKEIHSLVMIDYYTRNIRIYQLKSRSAENIIKAVERFIYEKRKPVEIVTNNAKEFVSEEFRHMLSRKKIWHRTTSVESHKSNERVERAIRTIREAMAKIGETDQLYALLMKRMKTV